MAAWATNRQSAQSRVSAHCETAPDGVGMRVTRAKQVSPTSPGGGSLLLPRKGGSPGMIVGDSGPLGPVGRPRVAPPHPPVKGAAARLAALGPTGPPLTAGLRFAGSQ